MHPTFTTEFGKGDPPGVLLATTDQNAGFPKYLSDLVERASSVRSCFVPPPMTIRARRRPHRRALHHV